MRNGDPQTDILGSLLLKALVVSARAQRHDALSLSGEPDNPAQGPWRRGRTRSGRLYRLVDFGVADLPNTPATSTGSDGTQPR